MFFREITPMRTPRPPSPDSIPRAASTGSRVVPRTVPHSRVSLVFSWNPRAADTYRRRCSTCLSSPRCPAASSLTTVASTSTPSMPHAWQIVRSRSRSASIAWRWILRNSRRQVSGNTMVPPSLVTSRQKLRNHVGTSPCRRGTAKLYRTSELKMTLIRHSQ